MSVLFSAIVTFSIGSKGFVIFIGISGNLGGWGGRGVVGCILVKFDGEITAIGADVFCGEVTATGVDEFDGENTTIGADKFDGDIAIIGADRFNGGVTGISFVEFNGGISTTFIIGELKPDIDIVPLVAATIMHAVRIKNKIIFTQVCETVEMLEIYR